MADASQQSVAEDDDDFDPDPQGWADRWRMEFAAARKETKNWHKQGERIVKRYLDEREAGTKGETRWNLFPANVETTEALLYGKTPSVDVTRRFQDSQDDEARVAAQMLERMLNGDIERNNDKYSSALKQALQDHLLPGLGNVRLRYVVEMDRIAETPALTDPGGKELAPVVAGYEVKGHEDVETDYVFWRDQLWSPARIFDDIRWWAFRASMTRKQIKKRFGAEAARDVALNTPKEGSRKAGDAEERGNEVDAQKADPWARADVWEIWDREHLRVHWLIEGMPKILESAPDPLELEGFWPFPRPLIANATTSRFLPRPDYVLAQDLYNEIDRVSTRITLLEQAVRVVGVYDKSAGPAVERMLGEASSNELIAIEGWGGFREKGGLAGIIDWFPLEQTIKAIGVLREYRTELISAEQQITGMSDIMRGEAGQTATATEQSIKAKFGSVRIQRRQDEFARFATDVQRLRAEIICKHFDPQTIIERSNIGNTPDAALAQQAVELLKSEFSCYRIQVKPESVSLTDYAALKSERGEAAAAITNLFEKMIPAGQGMPEVVPEMLEIAQWVVAGFRGASSVESVFDRMTIKVKQKLAQAQAAAAQAALQPQLQQPPDPKIMAAHIKAQGDVTKTQVASQARLHEISAETQADATKRAVDAHFTIAEDEARDRRSALKAVANVTGGGP